jgi:hypothetical protein
MFTKGHYINIISSIVIWIISLLYIYKFASVFFERPILFVLIYTFLFFFIVSSFDKIKIMLQWKNDNKYFLSAIFVFVLILFYYVIYSKNPAGSFELLTIKNWLHNFHNGTYPYQLSDIFTFSPFFYLCCSFFYWVGNIALFEVLVWGLFAGVIILMSEAVNEKIIKIFFLLVSPLTFYGIFQSFGIFFYSFIITALIYFSNKFLEPAKTDKNFILLAVIFGVLFSIKIEGIAILIIYLLFFFRNNLKQGILFFVILIIALGATIIPFVFWNSKLFFITGPFAPSSFFNMPSWEIILYLIITIYTGWMIADSQEVFFSIGILLIIPWFINTIFFPKPDSMASLANSLFCLPFFISAIKNYKIEKFIGKRLTG